MAGNRSWIKILHHFYHSTFGLTPKRAIIPGACIACGSVMFYLSSNKSYFNYPKNSFVAYAAAPKHSSKVEVKNFIS